jgi:hypothetical protein
MNDKIPNPPAFPGIEGAQGYGNSTPIATNGGEATWQNHNQGLSTRAYIATAAMQALIQSGAQNLLADELLKSGTRQEDLGKSVTEGLCRGACSYADALMAQLAKTKE